MDEVTPIKVDPRLTMLAKQIKDQWAKLQDQEQSLEAMEKSIKEARLAFGKLLLDAKQKVGHGNFGKWIEDNCQITPRQCQRYMAFVKSDIDADEERTWLRRSVAEEFKETRM